MFVVKEAFDDNTAILMDLNTYARKEMSEADLIRFVTSGHEVLGLSVSQKHINYITAYNCLSFATESEADEYIRENNLTFRSKRYINGLFWVLEKNNKKVHVDYYICTYAGPNATYVAKNGYTPYIQAAQSFDKKTAGKQARMMTINSKTGKRWFAHRVVRRFG